MKFCAPFHIFPQFFEKRMLMKIRQPTRLCVGLSLCTCVSGQRPTCLWWHIQSYSHNTLTLTHSVNTPTHAHLYSLNTLPAVLFLADDADTARSETWTRRLPTHINYTKRNNGFSTTPSASTSEYGCGWLCVCRPIRMFDFLRSMWLYTRIGFDSQNFTKVPHTQNTPPPISVSTRASYSKFQMKIHWGVSTQSTKCEHCCSIHRTTTLGLRATDSEMRRPKVSLVEIECLNSAPERERKETRGRSQENFGMILCTYQKAQDLTFSLRKILSGNRTT